MITLDTDGCRQNFSIFAIMLNVFVNESDVFFSDGSDLFN